MRIALRHLDQQVVAAFNSFPWYSQHYEIFQLMNLTRILPYCTDPTDTKCVTDALDSMLADKHA